MEKKYRTITMMQLSLEVTPNALLYAAKKEVDGDTVPSVEAVTHL